ncbi:FHA domain-containing protein, partial [Nonomuraea sp. RK-328]|nr:FHA domain-containing protein [Nonomuraea sp. RK-328]
MGESGREDGHHHRHPAGGGRGVRQGHQEEALALVDRRRRQARPPLGALLVDDGQVLPLDRPYLIGRRPETAPEVADGTAEPVPVDDREQSVSRRHLLVDLDGWDVVVVDLGSTNGTALLTPESPGFAELPPESPVVLPPGAVIRVGLSRTLRFEPHRLAP